eukprot:15289023-Ditylum_brightwellii.AAC.1
MVLEVAFHEQTHIGWDDALKGFLSLKWQRIQAEQLIQKMLNVSWDFCHHSNHYLQLANGDDQVNLVSKLDSQ